MKGSFNPGDVRFRERPGIQCACVALFAISYSTIKEIGRWDQLDLDIVLINRNS